MGACQSTPDKSLSTTTNSNCTTNSTVRDGGGATPPNTKKNEKTLNGDNGGGGETSIAAVRKEETVTRSGSSTASDEGNNNGRMPSSRSSSSTVSKESCSSKKEKEKRSIIMEQEKRQRKCTAVGVMGGSSNEESIQAAKEALDELRSTHGAPLLPNDCIMAMQAWNKMLAFKDAFKEALFHRWRLLVAASEVPKEGGEDDGCKAADEELRHPIHMWESNKDPLAHILRDRLEEAEDLLTGLLDCAVRDLCPHEQKVQRESYRPVSDDVHLARIRGDILTLECATTNDYTRLFARCGVLPRYWILFIESFVWAMQTHVCYAQEDDMEDFERGDLSAVGRMCAQHVAIPAVEEYLALRSLANDPVYCEILPNVWGRLDAQARYEFGETFYKKLLMDHPNLLDYFARTDMDSLAVHLTMSLDLMVKNVAYLGDASSCFRDVLEHLGDIHRKLAVPTYSFPLVGECIIDCLMPVFRAEEERGTASVDDLVNVFTRLYVETMAIVYYPALRQEKLIETAREFYDKLKTEFDWSEGRLSQRMMEVEREIHATGTYTQTSDELEMGARLAWRNSAKCIGRISWNTLRVRDCRHRSKPRDIFADVHEHLRIATAGTNIQSVMTVFAPKSVREPLGSRFWSSQYVRYAAYEIDGKIVGDPANKDITKYLIEHKYWSPPEPKGRFDVLPLVFKVPGEDEPYIHQLPADVVNEVDIVHPTKPAISDLGYRWGTVPAITNFKMDLGGVVYQNMPFNGWFVSTEIVRNLMERYDAGSEIAAALGIDTGADPMWRQQVVLELERAVLYSFKRKGYTIVDPMSVGESFCVHVRREREQFNRECPGQWSWIGGLVGHTNPTWHLEMRDFLILPQYQYCAEGLALHEGIEASVRTCSGREDESTDTDSSEEDVFISTSRVLILYGSETGSAETVARRLKRSLQLLKPVLMTLNEARGLLVVKKSGITHVVCVCSTFGKGDPPSNAKQFFGTDFDESVPKATKFSVLSLGSTLYPNFCQAGFQLDKKLSSGGLERVTALQKCDEAAGADDVIEGWLRLMKTLLLPPNVESTLIARREAISDDPPVTMFRWSGQADPSLSKKGISADSALCVSNVELLEDATRGTKSIRKITFQVPKGSSYETGDHISVEPLNSESKVMRFLMCFERELSSAARKATNFPFGEDCTAKHAVRWQAEQRFELETIEFGECFPTDVGFQMPTSLRALLTSQLDLNIGAKSVVDVLKEFKKCLDGLFLTLNEAKKETVVAHPLVQDFLGLTDGLLGNSGEKTTHVDVFVSRFPTIMDFLEHFHDIFLGPFAASVLGRSDPNPLLKLSEVVMNLPNLQPRYYSISSSNRTNPDEVSISVGILAGTTRHGVPFTGVCSSYLSGLQGGVDRAHISIRKSTFRLPTNVNPPLIMIGAGTGLAPMVGFLEDRALDVANASIIGDIHLFFGCRTDDDFIYKDCISDYERKEMIELHLALSRTPNVPKEYVQQKLIKMGKGLHELLLNEDAHYYVCGDARMADECFEACVTCMREHGHMSRIAGVQHLKKMRSEGRWQTDVWGIVSNFEVSKKVVEKNRKMAAKVWLSRFTDD